MSSRILVVDDDPSLREVVRYALSRQGYTVSLASDGAKALAAHQADPFDLIVLDIVMPELDGIETCRALRQKSRVPIGFLSSRDEELDRVLGLEMGGDDYITKPFSTRELVARIKAVLRRVNPEPQAAPDPLLCVGRLRVDPEQHRAWVDEAEVLLTVTELAVLRVLMGRPGRVFTREELADKAYPGGNHHVSDRTLDSHIRRIRAKLREQGLDAIETVHGLGFRLGSGR